MKLLALIALATLGLACDKTPFKESKTFAGGKVVSAATLNLGYTTYQEYCVQCHGVKGDGNGPASKGLVPPPRNFTQGLYKFANVPYGELPHDADFHRIIRYGLQGTAMLPWDISDERLEAVTHYIKTFAPATWEGGDKALGVKIAETADPYGQARKAEAIERGAKVYHIGAQCTTCHRSYATDTELNAWNRELNNGAAFGEVDPTLSTLKLQDSEYNYKVAPPDFTYHELRTIHSTDDIYQRLLYGVTGSGMPAWKDVVSDDDLWALTYYVESLMVLRQDAAGRRALMEKLGTDN